MANPLRGEAPLGDSGRVLRFDVNALCLIEAELDIRLPALVAQFQDGIGIGELRLLIWAGMQHEGASTLEAAGDLISEIGFEAATAALTKAIEAALPQSDGDARPPKTRTRKPTG